jgi:hypothetical protein
MHFEQSDSIRIAKLTLITITKALNEESMEQGLELEFIVELPHLVDALGP